jgi:hypothetical protein
MTPKKLKARVLAAWLAQMEKYAMGPVLGNGYCESSGCFLCIELYNEGSCGRCPLFLPKTTPGKYNSYCFDHKTYKNLQKYIIRAGTKDEGLYEITPALTAAMALRHEFYVRGYEVLKDAPPERFASGKGFPELLEIDRELMEEIK